MPKTIIAIPARLASIRFPEKILARKTGKYLIEHVYEQACRVRGVEKVIIAADDAKTIAAAESFGASAIMTDPELPSGTDRIAEVVKDIDCDYVINLQGDEVEFSPEAVEQLMELIASDSAPMASLARPFQPDEDPTDPNCVKVITDKNGHAIYFSRSLIPFPRDGVSSVPEDFKFYLHYGIYAYRRDFLLKLTKMKPAPIEKIEKLEQLRVLWNGYKIKIGITEHVSRGIDTPEEYEEFVERYVNRSRPCCHCEESSTKQSMS